MSGLLAGFLCKPGNGLFLRYWLMVPGRVFPCASLLGFWKCVKCVRFGVMKFKTFLRNVLVPRFVKGAVTYHLC